VSEVLTATFPPRQGVHPEIKRAYHAIEAASKERLLAMIPDALRPDYAPFLLPRDGDASTVSW